MTLFSKDHQLVEHYQQYECDACLFETAEHIMQGILVSGVAYYMQVWVIDKSGPVFLAMTMPITLLVTIILSLFLGEAVTLGRCVFVPLHISILPSFSCNEKMIYNLLTRKLTCSLQYLRWSSHGWWSLLCSLGKEV